VELKFIIIKAGGILCAVDQHAADERIALEKLENSLCNHGSGDAIIHMTKRSIKAADIIKVTKLLPSKRIILSQKQMSTVKYHWSLLQKWKFTMEEVEENTLLLTGVPSVCDRVASVNDFFDFVQELGHITGNDTKPNFVKSTLASNACRYATMFGDPLTHEQCVELISR
jgi:DNA mismatch repair ATPase MutL